MEAENINDFEVTANSLTGGMSEPITGWTIAEPVVEQKKVKKPKKTKKLVVKKVIESNVDKGSFNLVVLQHRYKVRYNAKLIKDDSKETIFESDNVIYKLTKI